MPNSVLLRIVIETMMMMEEPELRDAPVMRRAVLVISDFDSDDSVRERSACA